MLSMAIHTRRSLNNLASAKILPSRSSAARGYISKNYEPKQIGYRIKKLVMMNQQPDKLFREKLENFSKGAPASAWNRIETGLDKKNNKGLWLKVAASI